MKLTKSQIKEKLIKTGVKNLKEFGYPDCNEANILKDDVYKIFFKGMLDENLGQGKSIDEAINEIVKENKLK
jgi:hypothetical protein